MSTPPTETTRSITPISTAAEAEAFAARYVEVMDTLIGIVRQETELVKKGRLSDAAQLEQSKAELARRFIGDSLRLRACQSQIARIKPDLVEGLNQRHSSFRSDLQLNLTVLATAHSVSEGIVRGVSAELMRKRSPQTYGATGRPNAPAATAAQPLAISRTL